MGMKVTIPRSLLIDTRKLELAIENTLTANSKAVKVDFDVTTQTWKKRPTFKIDKAPGKRTISTDDEVYGYVNDGTRPHIIAPKAGGALVFTTPYGAKTAVRVIGSGRGSRGKNKVVTTKPVHHPGTDAREFDEAIKEKWDDKLPVTLQRSIDAAAE